MKKQLRDISPILESELLARVQKPGRYTGGEVNQVRKDPAACGLRLALCFPDTYEIGMSNSGMAIIYDVLNRLDGVAAERVFAPWLDAEAVMRESSIPLFTLENKLHLADMDVIGFCLTTELCYTNVLNMLDLAGLPVRSADRGPDDPIVIAGGGMSNCCEPLADFVDLFVLGEGEEAAPDLALLMKEMLAAGQNKRQILLAAARKFTWAYVPAFYTFQYDQRGISGFSAVEDGLPLRLENAVVRDFENAPVPHKPVIPFVQAVHERVSVEIMRGCPGRCRFCQASFCRRPVRHRSAAKALEIARTQWQATGYDTVSLLSLSTADYPHLEELIRDLKAFFDDKHVGVSLPSLRVGETLKLMPYFGGSVRKSGLTIAVEAGSERLRGIMNKLITDEDLFAGVEAAYRAGWQSIKLYFMAGLPGETEDDIRAIARLCARLGRLRRDIAGRNGSITAAVSWLVPKPHTPFGWLGQREKSWFSQVKSMLIDEKMRLNARFVEFKFHEIERSVLEAAVSRGDRRMCAVIENAWRSGARFDLWNECFDINTWHKAFQESGMTMEQAAHKAFDADEILPWEHLGGPAKDYLRGHYEEAMKAMGA